VLNNQAELAVRSRDAKDLVTGLVDCGTDDGPGRIVFSEAGSFGSRRSIAEEGVNLTGRRGVLCLSFALLVGRHDQAAGNEDRNAKENSYEMSRPKTVAQEVQHAASLAVIA
jgi:hypothetical protein